MSASAGIFALLLLNLAGSHCFEWTSDLPEGIVKYACAGDDILLPWNFTSSPGDDVLSMQWFFNGASQVMLAFFSHGNFAPMASFSGRVTRVSGAGISVSHVTTGESGNYSVEISGHDASGTFFTYRRTVNVQVMENNKLMTSDGQLHVTLETEAIYSNMTDRWSLVLSCGNFTYLSDPPFDMEWLTPSNAVPLQSSVGYTDGQYKLHVTSGGHYTCRIPLHAASHTCLQSNSTRQATVHVDKVEARFTLMEAELKQLKEKSEHLERDCEQLKAEKDLLRNDVSQLREKDRLLDTKDASFASSLQALTTKVSHRVAFTAMLGHQHTGGTILFDSIITNVGTGYSPSTGTFTAPVSGLYFFTLTSTPVNKDTYPDADIKKEGSVICNAASPVNVYGVVASCGAAVHLNTGENVWAESGYHLRYTLTSFSGFLIGSD